ncbi:hypothetical protein [Thiolinea disciformis]|uniref:hypothetical protein n=1 Tax=Thiolinea disciformis TaxID=125614 RepID=UPI0003628626|nr:hypothetical protein [Thiolinea disciformis]
MSQVEIFPLIAGLSAVASVIYLSVADRPISKNMWLFPAVLSLLFLVFSLQAVITEGPLGFWPEHTRNLWGNQIWYDLLLGVSAAIAFIIPRARKVKMQVLPWTLLCLATGSIGLYAFISRLLYLEARRHSD